MQQGPPRLPHPGKECAPLLLEERRASWGRPTCGPLAFSEDAATAPTAHGTLGVPVTAPGAPPATLAAPPLPQSLPLTSLVAPIPSLSFFWTEPHRRLEKAMLESFGFLLSCSFPLLRRPALPAPSPPSLWTYLAHLAPQCWALGLGGSPHPVPGPVAFLLASQVASGRHLPLVCALS